MNRTHRHAVEELVDETRPSDAKGTTGFAAQVKQRLWQRMARECEAMAQHALSTGRVIPVEAIEHLDQAASAPDGLMAVVTPDGRTDALPADPTVRSASTVPASGFALLAAAHAELALAIAPATPEAVRLMADECEKHPVWCELGPLPLVRQMLGLALLSLVILLAVSISAVVNAENMSKSLLELSGYPLFTIETFLVSASSLGSCFANLQRINTVISDGTYDPRVQSTYWTRWVMGVISGIVLSQLVYDFFLAHGGHDASARAIPDAIGQPLLALLGGYSVDFVHGILKRAITTLANFFGVSMDGATASQQHAAMAEAVATQRVALAAATIGRGAAPAANPDVQEAARRSTELTQSVSQKAS
ncbi:MAG: hypothetical protein JO007_13280 [Alphaproteobacteria bacterium]|nr:hypothetical protein [Alphaproteobacteria bacterium]